VVTGLSVFCDCFSPVFSGTIAATAGTVVGITEEALLFSSSASCSFLFSSSIFFFAFSSICL
jgi:hypothetical protein